MMFSSALNSTSFIMDKVTAHNTTLPFWMRRMSTGINRGIMDHAIISDPTFGKIYAYEIDGYGSVTSMDDPNIPSLLSAPFLQYTTTHDPIYANTRRKILSPSNPYFSRGPTITGVGSQHTLPGKVWPMANIMAILTSDDDGEIIGNLRMLLRSTGGTGLMHESVDSWSVGGARYTRSWFSWANGLFGQSVLDLEGRREWVLGMGFQD
jgi:meiotically up-regulated gene 157 (Mug157) protein